MRKMMLAAALLTAGAAPPKPPTMKLGSCQFTRVASVSTRLAENNGTPVAGSGTSIVLANGVYGVNYDQVPAADASKPGDRVLVCLVKLPTHCPPGDNRGKWYTMTNLRTMQSWTLPDAQHMCGGA